MGTSKGTDCLVIMPGFYQGKDYNPDNLHSHLKRSNLGGSQARKPNPVSKSVRTTLLSLNAFNDEERDCLEKGTSLQALLCYKEVTVCLNIFRFYKSVLSSKMSGHVNFEAHNSGCKL